MQDDDPSLVPGLSYFSSYIQLEDPEGTSKNVNHFTIPERNFFKSERRFKALILDHVTCAKALYILCGGIIFYFSFVFMLYALYKHSERKTINEKKIEKLHGKLDPRKGKKGS